MRKMCFLDLGCDVKDEKDAENHIWVLKDGVRTPQRVWTTMPSLTQNTLEPIFL